MKTRKKNIIKKDGTSYGSAREAKARDKSVWPSWGNSEAEDGGDWEEVVSGNGECDGESDEECYEVSDGSDGRTRRATFISAQEEASWVRRMMNGEISARDRLFEAFRPLAISVATRCFERWNSGLGKDDLIAWSYIGLMEGLSRFHPKFGARVSTCVIPYITKAVYRANANFGRLIRIPVNQTEKLSRYYAFVREYEVKNGASPSMEEAAQAIGIRRARLEHLVAITSCVQSLDADLGDCERGMSFGDRIADTSEGALEGMMDRERIDEVIFAIDGLNQRDSWIVKKRFNLDGEGYCTLDDIANRLDLTKERVRQLEKKALERLRAAVA